MGILPRNSRVACIRMNKVHRPVSPHFPHKIQSYRVYNKFRDKELLAEIKTFRPVRYTWYQNPYIVNV